MRHHSVKTPENHCNGNVAVVGMWCCTTNVTNASPAVALQLSSVLFLPLAQGGPAATDIILPSHNGAPLCATLFWHVHCRLCNARPCVCARPSRWSGAAKTTTSEASTSSSDTSGSSTSRTSFPTSPWKRAFTIQY